MITDRIGRHKVLLQINHEYNKIKIWDILGFLNQNKRNSESFLARSEKKKKKKKEIHFSVRVTARSVL